MIVIYGPLVLHRHGFPSLVITTAADLRPYVFPLPYVLRTCLCNPINTLQGLGVAVASTSVASSRSSHADVLELQRLREEVIRLTTSGEKLRVEHDINEERLREEVKRWKASYDKMRAEKGDAEASYADAAEKVREWATYSAEVEKARDAALSKASKAELSLSRVALVAPVEQGAAAARARVAEDRVRELTRERDAAFTKAASAEHAQTRATVAEARVRELTRECDAALAKAASAENALARTAVPMEQGATARRVQIAEAKAQELMRERDSAVARELAARDALARAPSIGPGGVTATRAGSEAASRLLGLLRTHLGGEER